MEAIRAERAKREAPLIRKRCKRLIDFVEEAWPLLEPNTPFVRNWHLEALCEHLEAVTYGLITRLLINIPPGTSKSLIVSVLWPAWEWGPCEKRSMRYLTTSFSEGPVKRDTRKCRDLIASQWYQTLWPMVVLTRTAEMSFANSDTGTREGVPFESLTSQRGDRLIIDDPHSTETAESDTERATTTRKFREGALNRLNDQKRSAIIVIMQRLHTHDISGVILTVGMGFVHLCLPMEFDPKRRCVTKIGFKDPRAKQGELLDTKRFPQDVVDAMKRDMTAYAWAGQYQQSPTPREGGAFKRHWFQIVPAAPAGGVVVRGYDLAATKKTQNTVSGPAYTCGVRMRYVRGVYYVESVDRERLSPAEVEALLKNTASQDVLTAPDIVISIPQDPGQAGKAQIAAFAKLLNGYNVRFSPETGSKEQRANPYAAQAEVGNVKLVAGVWNEPFIEEHCLFPGGPFSDQVDGASRAFAQIVKMTKSGAGGDIGVPSQVQ